MRMLSKSKFSCLLFLLRVPTSMGASGTISSLRGPPSRQQRRHLLSIADKCPCDGDWGSRDEYILCVEGEMKSLKDAGLITADDALRDVEKALEDDCPNLFKRVKMMCPCDGDFLNCVRKVLTVLIDSGELSKEKAERIMAKASDSDCGVLTKDPPKVETTAEEPTVISRDEEVDVMDKIKKVCPCDGEYESHDEYMTCVMAVIDRTLELKNISKEKAERIVARAVESDCGKARPDVKPTGDVDEPTIAKEEEELMDVMENIKKACPCVGEYETHEDYMSCVKAVIYRALESNHISMEKAEKIIVRAAGSDCGKARPDVALTDTQEEDPEVIEKEEDAFEDVMEKIKVACPCDGDYSTKEEYMACIMAIIDKALDSNHISKEKAEKIVARASDSRCGEEGPKTDEEGGADVVNTEEEEVIQRIKKSCPCDSDWSSHAAFVDCIIEATKKAVDGGYISSEKAEKMIMRAKETDCGTEEPIEEGDVVAEEEIVDEDMGKAERCKENLMRCLERAMQYEEEKKNATDEKVITDLDKKIRRELEDAKKYRECAEEAEADALDAEEEMETEKAGGES